MSLGTIETYVILFFVAIAIAGFVLSKNEKPKSQKTIRVLLIGIASIFLLAGLLTPPDLISTFVIAIPTTIIFSIIIFFKLK